MYDFQFYLLHLTNSVFSVTSIGNTYILYVYSIEYYFLHIFVFSLVESCLNKKSNTAYILLLEKAVTKNKCSKQGVSFLSKTYILKKIYFMAEIWPNIFSIDIFEKFTATLQFCYFLTCSYSHFLEVLGKREKSNFVNGYPNGGDDC